MLFGSFSLSSRDLLCVREEVIFVNNYETHDGATSLRGLEKYFRTRKGFRAEDKTWSLVGSLVWGTVGCPLLSPEVDQEQTQMRVFFLPTLVNFFSRVNVLPTTSTFPTRQLWEYKDADKEFRAMVHAFGWLSSVWSDFGSTSNGSLLVYDGLLWGSSSPTKNTQTR